ncbi:structure-specific endonuclease subunit SLX4 [Bradysia coprophila]|uniref:structure-specific endonuclease subunit SLX4 n=1 Tax=Bradysia coprophila TaxID=38358 RepID=UPI00187D9C62|nr:structure-specific endonuclease subunit SLX4 [Bradysia coprophila]
MDNNKKKSSKSRQKPSKAPPQISNFFSKPLSPKNQRLPSSPPSSPNERKRKLSEQEVASQNESPTSYAKSLERDAAKMSKIPKAKKASTVVSTFFQQANSDDLSDFESPSKKIQFKTPPVIPKKKVTRKRKAVTQKNKLKDALETEIFENALRHYSSENGMNSDDLQMALALSRSLSETHSTNESESSNISSVIRNAEPFQKEDIVRQTFQKFGFKKKDNSDYNFRDFFGNLGSKRKWSSKFTPLTRRSEHIQKEKFKNKVKNILQVSAAFETVDSQAIREYSITSSYLQQFFTPNSPSYNRSIAVTETNVEEFYVNNLVPTSTLRCGCLLKNWADIPGRDVSPQRALTESSNLNEGGIAPETTVEERRDEEVNLPNCNVDNIVGPSVYKEGNDLCDVFEYAMDVDHHQEDSNSHSSHLHTNQGSHEDIVTKIDLPDDRVPSPDMFADYESSANNSLDDDVLENQNAGDCSIISKDSPRGTSENILDNECLSITLPINNKNSGSQGAPSVLLVQYQENDGVVLSSDDSNEAPVKNPECTSTTSPQKVVDISSTILKQLSFTDRLKMYNSDPALITSDDDHISSLIDPSSQDSIVISDDEINYSINKCGEGEDHHTVGHHTMLSQESIVLSDSEDEEKVKGSQSMDYEAEERQSFASIELDNENDFGNESGLDINIVDEVFNSSQQLKNDTGSVRQLCLTESAFESEKTNISSVEFPSVDMVSQESIVLSDSDDDNKMSSQLTQNEAVERQSFASIDLGNEYDSEDEQGRDINIDDEIYNSNQSLNDDDLINLSVREMYRKEFVSESAKSSAKKSFSRTTSDLTFERKVWKPPKTPDKLHNISDDDFDEFDKLVRGDRYPHSPVPNVNSIEISDDELDKSLEIRQDNGYRDDISVTDLPTSPQECDEFIVQSMDQVYQVRTGKLVSPKPNYENMDSPTRLEHLKKYGLKTLSKRKAVICLEHIYNRLHPYIELDEQDDLDKILSQKEKLAINSNINRIDVIAIPSETAEALTESDFDVLQGNEDIFYLPSAPRTKNPWCLEPLHVAWHNLINSNATLYDAILQYKPVDLMDIRSLLKSIGLRYETNDIISFLDRKCITFKTDNKRNATAKKS